MKIMDKYEHWKKAEGMEKELLDELSAIAENAGDIEDRFYKSLEFGTGGLRGVIGAGSNRMNKFTVRKATKGLANYIVQHGKESMDKGVVIAYDSRHKSPEFALEAALVLAENGVKAYVFETLRPTPELSFAVRHLNATAGIVVTASHNPPEYNGYKVYWSDGAQVADSTADAISQEFNKIEDELQVAALTEKEAKEAGLLQWIGSDIDEEYIKNLASLAYQPKKQNEDYKIVYTPLHGTGKEPVMNILKVCGFNDVTVVPEQEQPDADFPTVSSPNPEDRAAFTLAIELAEKEGADLIMGTDPDADRLGVLARDEKGQFQVLTGNQLGALLLDYTLSQLSSQGRLPENGTVIKTIVTSELGAAVAKYYGVETLNTLTGFKYIAAKIKEFEETKEKTFIFGYEESYGYLLKDFCRDKDAVQACLVSAEMGAYYSKQGLTLYQVLHNLYERVGYHQEDLVSITYKGIEGFKKMSEIMENLRHSRLETISAISVTKVRDYSKGIEGLPASNVLKYTLEDDSWFAVRPSGTEPKIKIYMGVKGTSSNDTSAKLAAIKEEVIRLVQ
jgi:phosphoglucomutase